MDKIIAVDFDGTLCENAYPNIGVPKQIIINHILEEQKLGAKLILWTNRCDEKLEEAVKWCAEHGIIFDAINDNIPSIISSFGNNCRKVFATEYIDDRALSVSKIEENYKDCM